MSWLWGVYVLAAQQRSRIFLSHPSDNVRGKKRSTNPEKSSTVELSAEGTSAMRPSRARAGPGSDLHLRRNATLQNVHLPNADPPPAQTRTLSPLLSTKAPSKSPKNRWAFLAAQALSKVDQLLCLVFLAPSRHPPAHPIPPPPKKANITIRCTWLR